MGTGYVRNDTSNNIDDGGVIDASDLDGEFNAIVDAFVNTTGHTHDGTASEGGAVSFIGPAQEFQSDGTAFFPKTTATYTLGKSGATFSGLFVDGITFGGTAITSTAAEINFLDGVTSLVQTQLDTKSPIADPTFTGTVTVTTVDINGGAIDGTTIGGVTAAAGSFTTLSTTGAISVGTTVDGRDVAADGTKLDTVETNADVTDTVNVTSSGALMDSELADIASVKALDQGVATTDSPTFVEVTATTGVYLGGTAAANLLDDYEEGTFTPIFSDGTNNAASYTNQSASYTKIGRAVTFNIRLQCADLGSMTGSVVRIAGLPFVSNATDFVSVDVGYGAGLAISQFSNVGGYIIPSTSTINLVVWASTEGILNLSVAALSADGYVMVSGTYNTT